MLIYIVDSVSGYINIRAILKYVYFTYGVRRGGKFIIRQSFIRHPLLCENDATFSSYRINFTFSLFLFFFQTQIP